MSTPKLVKTADTPKVPEFNPRNVVNLKVGWPAIYPENAQAPFIFRMRIQLVSDAEEVQRAFLMLPDTEQASGRHEYDAEMISLLSVDHPTGFPDYAPSADKTVAQALREYLLPEDPERREGMKFICRGVMIKYWSAVMPADYL